ncbi:MAG: hypothetical protein QM791_20595 [Ferruginibacter sp.]
MKYFYTFLFLFIATKNFAQTNEFVVFNEANTPAFAGTGNNFKCINIGDSIFWAGTQYKGLFKYDTTLQVWYKSGQLANVFINDIERDKKGGIWIAQSGTSGTVGGGSNTAGGINYFPDQFDVTMQFYSVPGTTTGGGLVSRNVRSIFVDTVSLTAKADTMPQVWSAAATYITSNNTSTGGISAGVNSFQNYFYNKRWGLQVFPYVNPFATGTPSCEAVGGNSEEIWISVRQNFGLSQILRYSPAKNLSEWGGYLGAYDSTKIKGGVFPVGFRVAAIFFDSEGKRWLGFLSGGLRVMVRGVWKIVNDPAIFPAGASVNNNAIAEDDQGNVYIGTNAGLLVYDGNGDVDNISPYKLYTTADGLPTNNITGLAYDKAKGRMLMTSDAGIIFWTVKNKIKVEQQWDYSFPKREGKPKGVVADGVARVYLKIKSGDESLPAIKEVKLSLYDYKDADSSTRGRLKQATIIDKYSEEASAGTAKEITVTDNIKAKEFWAWYVSPTDFSADSLGPDINKSTRTDRIKVVVTYVNNTKDSIIYEDLRIVRPPLLLVHGLASGPPTWSEFRHNNTILFTESDRWKYSHALTMNGRAKFIYNARLLMGGDLPDADTAKGKTNTLQGNIEQIRGMGYAANQVDYVCHSMGGIMIRHAIANFGYKFYTGADDGNRFKNYNQGFTHKIVFVNSPHNSSILGDGVDEFIPQAPEWLNNIMRAGYLYDSKRQMPYDFIQPITPDDILNTKFKASDAVNNLQVRDTKGGVNLAETRAKFHMITGNVNLVNVQTSTILAELDPTVEYANNIIKSMLNSRLVPPNIKNFVLKPMLLLGNVARTLTFFEWYSRNLGYPDYLAESDLIVPLASEHARIELPGAKPFITMYNNSPGSSIDASHITILKRADVGQRVFNLLNSKLYSPLFADVVPPNTDPDPLPILTARTLQRPGTPLATDSIYYDSTKIKIDYPVKGTDVFADSTVNLKFRLKDTSNLSYVNLVFQYGDTFSLAKTRAQQTIPLKIWAALPGKQTIWAVAAYNTADNGMKYYIDTFNVMVKNNAALQGFRVNEDPVTITGGEYYYPPYQVMYNNNWVSFPAADTSVSVSFDPAGITTRVDSVGGFKALKEGFTAAIFSYKGFADTVLINTVMPLDSFCVNRTIAAGSFKNPAIWSKKRVPDVCDSVVIQHAVTADTTVQFRSARINTGASLTLNNAALTVQLGASQEGGSMIDNYGTLTIQNGNLTVNGRVKNNAGSSFIMSGGTLKIHGNTGGADISVSNGLSLFEAATGMTQFNFSGGTIQITDPPFGDASQAINCSYNFGDNSTLVLGVNNSAAASKNADGFGGNAFPAKIGKLIIDAGTRNGNRQFINKKALSVKGSVEVRTGSGVILQAPLNVNK